jgi:hypothetical protein
VIAGSTDGTRHQYDVERRVDLRQLAIRAGRLGGEDHSVPALADGRCWEPEPAPALDGDPAAHQAGVPGLDLRLRARRNHCRRR